MTIQAVAQGLLSNYDLNGYCLEHLEALPASDTWTYTIGQDVPCYITESEQLSGAPLDALIAEAQDQFLASAAKNPNLTVNSANYYGYYLLTAKRYSGWQDYNRVFVVLEVNYTLDGETNTHYNPVEFDDVLIGTDGACHYDQVSNLYGWFWEDGADSIYDFETDHITPELADYHEFSGQ